MFGTLVLVVTLQKVPYFQLKKLVQVCQVADSESDFYKSTSRETFFRQIYYANMNIYFRNIHRA